MKYKRLAELSTDLTLRDFEQLLVCFAGRIIIHDPTSNTLTTLDMDDPCVRNGMALQLNCRSYREETPAHE